MISNFIYKMEQKLEQILRNEELDNNLKDDNIIKYSEATKTTIQYIVYEDEIIMSVEDNGKGIKDIEQAVRSFYSSKKKHAGLGFNYVLRRIISHPRLYALSLFGSSGTRMP